MSRSITKILKIAAGLIIGVFLLLVVIGMTLPDHKSMDSTTASKAAKIVTNATAQDQEWIKNTKNNIALAQQTDTLYKNELDRNGATYISKYNKAKDVENIAIQGGGISQPATVSPDLQVLKDNYENYLTHLRLYAAWKAKAWDSMNSEGISTQGMDYGQSGQIEEETAREYLEKYNSGMSEYLKSHLV